MATSAELGDFTSESNTTTEPPLSRSIIDVDQVRDVATPKVDHPAGSSSGGETELASM